MALVERKVIIKAVRGGLAIVPDSVGIRGVGRGEEVVWRSQATFGEFTVSFDKPAGSPFGWPSDTSVNRVLHSGEPTFSGANPLTFAYTLTAMVRPSGTGRPRQVVIDPEVIVDDNTPPPVRGRGGTRGGGRARRRKPGRKKTPRRAARKKTPRRAARRPRTVKNRRKKPSRRRPAAKRATRKRK